MTEADAVHARPSLAKRIARGGAKLTVAAVMIAIMVGGISLLQLRAQLADESDAVPPLPVAVAALDLQTGYDLQQRYAGRLEARRSTALAFERGGLLMEVLVEEGDTLGNGQLVARLDVEPLEARRAELMAQRQAVLARLELARITTRRQQALVNQGNASKQRFDEARLEATALEAEVASLDAAIRQLDIDIGKSSLVAPYAGRVAARYSDEGAIVAAGTPVVDLVESAVMQARIGISPTAASSLSIGRDYGLQIEGRTVPGRLVALRPDMATGTRTVSALFDVAAQPGFFLGELAVMSIARRVQQEGFWLPVTALVAGPKGLWTVYTVEQNGEGQAAVAQEAVQVHHVAGELAYVTGSLPPGGLLVMEGPHRIVPGQLVTPQEVAPPTAPSGAQPGTQQGTSSLVLFSAPSLPLPGTAN